MVITLLPVSLRSIGGLSAARLLGISVLTTGYQSCPGISPLQALDCTEPTKTGLHSHELWCTLGCVCVQL